MTAVPVSVVRHDSTRTLEEQFSLAVERSRRTGQSTVISVSTAARPVDPVAVFETARRRGHDAVLWHLPWQDVALVGVGSAWTVTAAGYNRFDDVSSRWRALMRGAVHVVDDATGPERGVTVGVDAGSDAGATGPGPGPMLLGGFAFEAGSATGPWTPFGDARLELPRVMYGHVAGRVWTTVNTVVTAATDPRQAAESVVRERDVVVKIRPSKDGGSLSASAAGQAAAAGEADDLQRITQVEDVQPKEHWLAAVEEVAGAIRSGRLDKAVLARSARVVSPIGFDIGAALRYLLEHYPECYVFAIGRGEDCFLGATPERIVHKAAGHIQVACMAGSIARGATPEEDRRLGQQLLADAKNMEEHRIVLRSILEALEPVCIEVAAAPRTGLRKLANVQHLYTPVTARVAGDTDVLALVSRVHPTPAIGGYPKKAALELIRAKEDLDRGWYAGPVGWMDGAGDGEFVVGLRSALIRREIALLFAGCGIMGDSVPESEYEESVLKLRPMLAALEAGR